MLVSPEQLPQVLSGWHCRTIYLCFIVQAKSTHFFSNACVYFQVPIYSEISSTCTVVYIFIFVLLALGVASGALLVYLWKPKGRQTSLIQLVVVAVAIPFVFLFLSKCPSYNVAGIVVPYADGFVTHMNGSQCSVHVCIVGF